MSKFAETFPEAGAGRIEVIESLGWLKRRAREGDVGTYLVQIVNHPHQITVLKVRDRFLKLFLIKNVAELVVECGRGSVEMMEFLPESVRRHDECS